MFIALDVASSELWAGGGRYVFKKSGEADRTSEQMVELYEDWIRQYPIVSIEDGVAEGDWDGWKLLTQALGDRVQLVGDDVFVTNPEILKRGIADKVGNAPAGEAESDRHRHRNARRRGDGARRRLRDDHLAPLRRDRGLDDRRPGGRHRRPARSRPARRAAPIASCKYNQLLRIEEELGASAAYAGRAAIRALASRT